MLPYNIDANMTWFDFKMLNAGSALGELSVYAFAGVEKVNAPYEFSVELVSRDGNLDLTAFLGKEALLTVADRSGKARMTHGVIRQMEQLHTANAFTHYRCELVPRLWFLGQTQEHRIYQCQTVPQIIEAVLRKNRFLSEAYSFKLRETYLEREYCVQYGESDLHFLSRVCEEEGIFFYFEHSATMHCLCFSDAEGGLPIFGENTLRFFAGSGQPADTAVISRLNFRHRINSDMATYREWNFTTPGLDLTGYQQETDWNKAPIPQALPLETYQFPHLYQERSEGERYAKLQLQRQLTFRQWIECESDVSRLIPGFTFSITNHQRLDVNRSWFIVSVEHEGEQPGVLEHESPDNRGLRYRSRLTAIPSDIRFVPEQKHKKIRIEGVQSAIVTGPDGEEIYTDEYGRVKLQFHWDRLGNHDETTTCWVRVAQGWAGGEYGTLSLPRIGHEVFVEFMEGDPDRPVVTGRAYHKVNRVPYDLPTHKTRTVFKSMSTPGNKDEQRGFNELRIEDKKGEEEIYLHAQKDFHGHIKNNLRDSIGNDVHRTVGHNTYLHTKGETHELFDGVHRAKHSANTHQTVIGDSHVKIDGKWLGKAGEEIHFRSGMKGVIECGTELTLKAAGGFIKIDPCGIKIVGVAVDIDSGGSPGNGSGANPELPAESVEVGSTKMPVHKLVPYTITRVEAVEKAAEDHSMFCNLEGNFCQIEGA